MGGAGAAGVRQNCYLISVLPQPLNPSSPSLLLSRAQGDELDLLATQLDLELISGFQAQLGGVGLADEQVAVELDLGVEAQVRPGRPLPPLPPPSPRLTPLASSWASVKAVKFRRSVLSFLVQT